MPSNHRHPALLTVRRIFEPIIDVPYCTGTSQLNASQSLLFYRTKDGPKFIDFSNPTELQLKELAEACSPASFGGNYEDILDGNYCQAGEMDSACFSAQFSPWDSGVLRTVVESLFKANGLTANVTAEIYKLHVYGPGSFFTVNSDAPRHDKMFGSLIVVLPTPHTGGILSLRQHNIEYMFDFSRAISGSAADGPHVALAALFNDAELEHTLPEVTSGYRVTLTYNLCYAILSPLHGLSDVTVQNDAQTLSTLSTALASLLTAPNFLPDGGLLAFGLLYDYPFDPQSTRLSNIERRLKGIDALLQLACDELELKASVKMLYCERYTDREYCLMDEFVKFEYEVLEDSLRQYLCTYETAILGYDALSDYPAPTWADHRIEVLPVVWANRLGDHNAFKQQYIAYDNEMSMDCAFGKVCLVVHIKPAAERG